MSAKKFLFVLLLIVIPMSGCNMLEDRQPPPVVETVPPYWQPQGEMEELQAFHEKESAKRVAESEEVHIVHNREMERLEAAGEELKKEELWQEDYEKTIERREKWFGWMGKDEQEESPALSSRTEEANKTLR